MPTHNFVCWYVFVPSRRQSSNHRNFSVEPSQIAIGPYGTAAFEVCCSVVWGNLGPVADSGSIEKVIQFSEVEWWVDYAFWVRHGIKTNKVKFRTTCLNQILVAAYESQTDTQPTKRIQYIVQISQEWQVLQTLSDSSERLAKFCACDRGLLILKSKRQTTGRAPIPRTVTAPSVLGGVHPFFSRNIGDRRRHSDPRGPGRLGIRNQRRGRDAGGNARAPRGCHGGNYDEHHVSIQVTVHMISKCRRTLAEAAPTCALQRKLT